ncbi:MAG: VWA domain-containing protein [Erysipelotrichaceae bacterium]|nr:VWA domain-containing protein [Erysipelotrichaceae bacterium]
MKKNLTELVFIMDRSGSMSGLEEDTIGGFNSFIEKQKREKGECLVSTVLFNQHSKVIHDRVSLSEIKKMTRDDYLASGTTALIDALGDGIHHIKTVHRYIRKEDVPANTIFVIITDGLENASHKHTSDEVKKMVEQQKEEGWEFLFLAANIDAVETAKHYGISADRATEYCCDEEGIETNFNSLEESISHFRKCGSIAKNWDAKIRKDYQSRKANTR